MSGSIHSGEWAQREKKKNFTSLEFDVLFSEIHKVKSVILTASAVKLKDLLKQRNRRRESAVSAVLPEGQTVTEMKRKHLYMKMT